MSEYLRAQAGDAGALSALLRCHSKLVWALANRFRDQSEDAFQWGCLGLVRAIRGFDPKAGCRFSTYAVPVVLGEMRRAGGRDMGWRERAKLKRLRDYLASCGEESPDVQAASRALGMEKAEIAFLLERLKAPMPDAEAYLRERVPDPRGEQWMTRLLIRDILERMEQGERRLLIERFWHGLTQRELGKRLRVDPSRVSRREQRAKRHFRQAWLDPDSF